MNSCSIIIRVGDVAIICSYRRIDFSFVFCSCVYLNINTNMLIPISQDGKPKLYDCIVDSVFSYFGAKI